MAYIIGLRGVIALYVIYTVRTLQFDALQKVGGFFMVIIGLYP